MAIYAIGDVHGCYIELMLLLKKIDFNPHVDKLLFVGDLINRGPNSNAVLDFVRDHDECAQTVLGNHDISLLVYHAGIHKKSAKHYEEILKRRDAADILAWMTTRPLMIDVPALNTLVVHAGLPPQLTIAQSLKLAKKTEAMLQGARRDQWLAQAYEAGANLWSASMSRHGKFRFALNAFTRMRYCYANGRMDLKEKRGVGEHINAELMPWFDVRQVLQPEETTRIVFGHWASLGLFLSKNSLCLDSGCAWGGCLTAVQLDGKGFAAVQVKNQQASA